MIQNATHTTSTWGKRAGVSAVALAAIAALTGCGSDAANMASTQTDAGAIVKLVEGELTDSPAYPADIAAVNALLAKADMALGEGDRLAWYFVPTTHTGDIDYVLCVEHRTGGKADAYTAHTAHPSTADTQSAAKSGCGTAPDFTEAQKIIASK